MLMFGVNFEDPRHCNETLFMETRRLELYHAEVPILGTRQTCNLIATVMDPLAMFL